eukprot:gene7095-7308_t
MARAHHLSHFGHRMLSDLPALFALRIFLISSGVDISLVRVVFTDSLGLPAWGPENFKHILHSLGFSSYHAIGHQHQGSRRAICFDRVLFVPSYFYPKWHTRTDGARVNMWQAPEQLYDTDRFHMKMIQHLRSKAFGLPASIPFAPAENRTVVLASRDRGVRAR